MRALTTRAAFLPTAAIAAAVLGFDLLYVAKTRSPWMAALWRMPSDGRLSFALGAWLAVMALTFPWLLVSLVARATLLPRYFQLPAPEVRPAGAGSGTRTFIDLLLVEIAARGIAWGSVLLGALPGCALLLLRRHHPVVVGPGLFVALAGALATLLYVVPGIVFATRLVVFHGMPAGRALQTNWLWVAGRRRRVLAALAVAFALEVVGLVGIPVFLVGALVTMPLARAYRDALLTRIFFRLAKETSAAVATRLPSRYPTGRLGVATVAGGVLLAVAARPSVASAQLVGGGETVIGGHVSDTPIGQRLAAPGFSDGNGVSLISSAGPMDGIPVPLDTGHLSFLGGLGNSLIVKPAKGAWALLAENSPLLIPGVKPNPSEMPVTTALIDHVVGGITTAAQVVLEGTAAAEVAEEGGSPDGIVEATPTFGRLVQGAITGVETAAASCTPGGERADAYSCGEAVGDGIMLGASVVPVLKAPGLLGGAGKGLATAADATAVLEAGEAGARAAAVATPKRMVGRGYSETWLLPGQGAGELDLGRYAPGTHIKIVVLDEYAQPFDTSQRFTTWQKVQSLVRGESPLGQPVRRSIGYGVSDNVFVPPRTIDLRSGKYANGDPVPGLVAANGGHKQILEAMKQDPLVCKNGCPGLTTDETRARYSRWVVRAGGVTVTENGFEWSINSWMNAPLADHYDLFERRALAPAESRVFRRAVEPHLTAPGSP